MGLSQENQNTLNNAQYLAHAGFIPLLVPSIRMVVRESGVPHPECQCWKKDQCSAPGKHPVRSWKDIESPQQAMALVHTILQEARARDTFNLGLKTGHAGGIFVIDIDYKADSGFSGYENWTQFLRKNEINHPMHYETLTARTGGGGQHFIYKYPQNGDRISNAVNHPAFNFKANPKDPSLSGIDVRGDGGFIVVAPSRHKSGNFYQWLTDPANSLRAETPKAILLAVSHERKSRDPDSDYTPQKEELEAYAERLIRKKKGQTNIEVGRDLRNVLAGIPIHLNGAAHDHFRSITFRVAQEWPRANPARLMEFFAESIAAREKLVPGGSCTHADVLNGLTTALEKCREESEHWENKLVRSKNGEGVLGSSQNAQSYLRNDPLWFELFATNARSARPFIMRAPAGLVLGSAEHSHYPRPLMDVDQIYMLMCFERRFQTKLAVQHMREAVQLVCAENAFDPFQQYLDRLPEWDGIGRVDTWLSVLGGAEDTPITRAFGALWLLQAVYRTLEPGCQADYCLILEGNQGIGKSSLLRALVPHPSLFDDGLNPIDHTGHKDNLVKLGGPVILELAELSALRKGDVEFIKAFLTLREDTYRPHYREHPITMLRRCVFAGTTNSGQYLRDTTGNRRFLPVLLGKERIDISRVVANRDQIWAEALFRALRKEPAYLSPEMEAIAREIQDSRKEVEPWQEIVENWLDEAQERIRQVMYYDLAMSNSERLGPSNAPETPEDPDKIASMFWLEKYDDPNVPKWDGENVTLYGEVEHFSIEDLLECRDVPVAQRTAAQRNSIRNVLVALKYERVRWKKHDKYRDKTRWLRKKA